MRARDLASLLLILGLAHPLACEDQKHDPSKSGEETEEGEDAGIHAEPTSLPTDAGRPPHDASFLADASIKPQLPGADGGAALLPSGGDTCRSAERLRPKGVDVLRLTGSTSPASHQSSPKANACFLTEGGRDVHYELDLTGYKEAVDFIAVVSADWDSSLSLTQGECDDAQSLMCQRRGSGRQMNLVTRRLQPGQYQLVLDGADADAHGSYEIHASFLPVGTEPECSSFEQPKQVSLTGNETWFFGDARCEETDKRAYFELDLSGQAAPVNITAMSLTAKHLVPSYFIVRLQSDEGDWEWASWARGPTGTYPDGAIVDARLAPGPVRLALDFETTPAPDDSLQVPMRLNLDMGQCPMQSNDTCKTAIPIETNSDDVVVIEGDTRCSSTDDFEGACLGDYKAAELFYRFDLSAATAPTRVRIRTVNSATLISSVLHVLRESDGDCGEHVFCQDPEGSGEGPPSYDLVLDPDVYLLSVGGLDEYDVGRFEVQIHFSNWTTREYASCIDSAMVDDCMQEAEPYCCRDIFDPHCPTVMTSCGLDPMVMACVCAENPACCGGPGDVAGCFDLYNTCGVFCPGLLSGAAASCFEQFLPSP